MEINRILLDTSAYSAFLRGHAGVKLAIQQAGEIFLNPIVVGELLAGFAMGNHERKNKTILHEFFSSLRVKFIGMDEETSERYAVITNHLRKQGAPIPSNDLWIAASAMQYGLKVLTTDSHYLKVPQIITEWYKAE